MRKTLIPALLALMLVTSCSIHTPPAPTAVTTKTDRGTVEALSAQVTVVTPDKSTLPAMETLRTIAPTTTGSAVPKTPARRTADVAPESASPATTATQPAPLVVYVSVEGRANVREAPSTDADIVDRLARGTAVTVTPLADRDWYRITEGRFVAASVVSRTKPATSKTTVAMTPAAAKVVPKSLTPSERLDACIDQVDPHRTAKWFLQSKGVWGQTWIPEEEIYISPAVPAKRVCDVVRHEWIHILQSRAWGLGLYDETNRILGTKGQLPVDQVADCGAQLLGAEWVNYGCRTKAERTLAADLLAGKF